MTATRRGGNATVHPRRHRACTLIGMSNNINQRNFSPRTCSAPCPAVGGRRTAHPAVRRRRRRVRGGVAAGRVPLRRGGGSAAARSTAQLPGQPAGRASARTHSGGVNYAAPVGQEAGGRPPARSSTTPTTENLQTAHAPVPAAAGLDRRSTTRTRSPTTDNGNQRWWMRDSSGTIDSLNSVIFAASRLYFQNTQLEQRRRMPTNTHVELDPAAERWREAAHRRQSTATTSRTGSRSGTASASAAATSRRDLNAGHTRAERRRLAATRSPTSTWAAGRQRYGGPADHGTHDGDGLISARLAYTEPITRSFRRRRSTTRRCTRSEPDARGVRISIR